MYTYEIEGHFDAAHYLPNHPGRCATLHGHTWKVKVVFGPYYESDVDDEAGFPVDFTELDKGLNSTISLLDHCHLNDLFANPTAETIAKWIYEQLASGMWPVISVTVYESPGRGVTYQFGEEDDE
jgi:6-pyruvoyltetrahydropterin/6-carboxytetrahydropterin synthase